jgi:hypothetical protein
MNETTENTVIVVPVAVGIVEWLDTFLAFVARRADSIVLTLGVILAFYILYRMHTGRNHIDLADLICTDGYINDKKFRKTGAWVITTWGFAVLVLRDKIQEWYFLGYMGAWVLDAGYDRWVRHKENIALGKDASVVRGDRPPAPPEPEIPEGANPK